jgi:radical SAM protein with 4Fe4S-binding SPASM domain
MHIKPFAHLRARLAGETPVHHGTCEMVPDCSELSMAVLPKGEVTLCDNFAHPDALISAGNLFEQPLSEIRAGPVWASLRQQVRSLVGPECLACRYLPVCFGGCLAKSRTTRSGEPRRFHYCAAYQELLRAIEAEG